MFLLLTLKRLQGVFIVDSEQVNVTWDEAALVLMARTTTYLLSNRQHR